MLAYTVFLPSLNCEFRFPASPFNVLLCFPLLLLVCPLLYFKRPSCEMKWSKAYQILLYKAMSNTYAFEILRIISPTYCFCLWPRNIMDAWTFACFLVCAVLFPFSYVLKQVLRVGWLISCYLNFMFGTEKFLSYRVFLTFKFPWRTYTCTCTCTCRCACTYARARLAH